MRYSVKHNASEIKGEIEEFMKTSNFIIYRFLRIQLQAAAWHSPCARMTHMVKNQWMMRSIISPYKRLKKYYLFLIFHIYFINCYIYFIFHSWYGHASLLKLLVHNFVAPGEFLFHLRTSRKEAEGFRKSAELITLLTSQYLVTDTTKMITGLFKILWCHIKDEPTKYSVLLLMF